MAVTYSRWPWVVTPVTSVTLWDDGLKIRTTQVSVEDDFLALDLDYVRDKVLRVANGTVDDEFITNCIRSATEMAEFRTFTNIIPRRLALVTDGSPVGKVFELRGHPVRDIVSVAYYDSANEQQTLAGGSPDVFLFTPSGIDLPATVQPLVGESWPSSYARSDAFTVTYDVGYETAEEVPHMLKMGIALMVGELYKNRDFSNDIGQVANVIGLEHFWPRRW